MGDRLRTIQRVLVVQTQLHRLAQWKLAELERKEDELSKLHESLIRFVDEDGSYSALFGNALMRRLRGVSEERAKVLTAQKEQAGKILEELQRLGRAQRMNDKIEQEERTKQNGEELKEILELFGNRRNASPR